MEYKYTSIVLGKRDVGETDRIYSLYTLEGGKIQVLAKGVRKPQAKLAGSLENFTFADILIAKNQGMGKITGVVVENSFPSLRTDYFSISKVLASFNIFNKLVDLDHKDSEAFNLLKEYLEAVDSQSLIASTVSEIDFENKVDLLSAIFVLKLLNLLGYGIEIENCPECDKQHKYSNSEEFFFSAQSGGLVCMECAKNGKASLRLSSNAVKLINLLVKNNLKSFMKIKSEKKDINFLNMVVRDFLAWI